MLSSANNQVGGPSYSAICPFSCYNIVLKCYGDLLVLQLCLHNWMKKSWKRRGKNPPFVVSK